MIGHWLITERIQWPASLPSLETTLEGCPSPRVPCGISFTLQFDVILSPVLLLSLPYRFLSVIPENARQKKQSACKSPFESILQGTPPKTKGNLQIIIRKSYQVHKLPEPAFQIENLSHHLGASLWRRITWISPSTLSKYRKEGTLCSAGRE